MTVNDAHIDEETAWALLLALRQAARAGQPLPIRVALSGNERAPWIEVTGEAAWVSPGPVTASGVELLDLYLPMALAGGHRPLTVAHLGQSLDGRIAMLSGASCTISSPENLTHLHRMRALCDAIIVGANTVDCDNPRLTTRRVHGPHPIRVVLDPHRRLGAHHHLFHDPTAPTWLVCSTALAAQPAPGRAGILAIPTQGGRLQLAELLRQLHQRGLAGVFIEGGGLTVSAFLEAGLLDWLQVAVAPLIIGSGRPGLTLPVIDDLTQGLRPPCRHYRMGSDVLFDCRLR